MKHAIKRAVINDLGASDSVTQIKRLCEQLGIAAGLNLDALADVLTDPNWLQGPTVICWLACPKARSGWHKTLYDTLEEAAGVRDDLTFVVR